VPLHRLLSVEVKFRSNVEEFLRRFGSDLITRVGEQWRELYVIFVTDHPAAGRSRFQVLDFQESSTDAPLGTIDLHEAQVFGISKPIIEEHERLVRQLFSPLNSPSIDERRKPLTKLSSHKAQTSSTAASASGSPVTLPRSVDGFVCTALARTANGYRLYWGIYVIPVSWFTRPYLMAIAPFRRILYPAMLRRIRRAWIAAYGATAT
jgi:hypothetical protein